MTTTPPRNPVQRSPRARATAAFAVTTTTTVYPTRLTDDPDALPRARALLVNLLDQSRVASSTDAHARVLYVSPQLVDAAAHTLYLRAAIAVDGPRGVSVVPVTEEVALVLGALLVHLDDPRSFVHEAFQMAFVDTLAHAVRLLGPALTVALQLDRPLVIVVF